MSATRSCTTATSSRDCKALAPCSSRSSPRYRPSIASRRSSFRRMACRNRCRRTPQARNLFYLDATCPLVSKVHKQAMRHQRLGRHVLLIGHAGHPEVIGTMGQLPDGAVTLIETEADAARLCARRSAGARLRHPDHAVGRGHRRHHPRLAGSLSAICMRRRRNRSATPPPTARRRSRKPRPAPISS